MPTKILTNKIRNNFGSFLQFDVWTYYSIGDDAEKESNIVPEFCLTTRNTISREDEKDIVKMIIDKLNESDRPNVAYISVSERPLNFVYMTNDFLSQRFYLNDGTLWVTKGYASLLTGCSFKGRWHKTCPLKKRALVDYIGNHDEIRQGIIAETPVEPINGAEYDEYDDSYLILPGDKITKEGYKDHDHIAIENVFPRGYFKKIEEKWQKKKE